MEELLRKHRLRWLGHVARMNDQRLPKQMLFGELKKSRPPHGVRRRWQDLVLADVTTTGIKDWYTSAQERGEWAACCQPLTTDSSVPAEGGICAANQLQSTGDFQCGCGRSF